MTTTAADVRHLLAAAFVACGVPQEHAESTAHILVLTEQWGLKSHGLLRVPHYLRRLLAGGCNPDARLGTVTDAGAAVVLDGDRGLGHWQAWRAAELGVDRARLHGVSWVSVADSNHCGALGTYTLPAVEAGMVALVFSNGPAVMPPWGGTVPVFSTSPLAGGIPGEEGHGVVDMAMSTVARGKIAALADSGEALPEGWALDKDGAPTTDLQAALHGMLSPLGGAKGYALAFLVESLTGVLVGPSLSAEVRDMFDPAHDAEPQRTSHTIITLDPAVGGAAVAEDTRNRFDDLAARVREAGGRVPGSRRTGAVDPDAPMRLSDAWRGDVASTMAPVGFDHALLAGRA